MPQNEPDPAQHESFPGDKKDSTNKLHWVLPPPSNSPQWGPCERLYFCIRIVITVRLLLAEGHTQELHASLDDATIFAAHPAELMSAHACDVITRQRVLLLTSQLTGRATLETHRLQLHLIGCQILEVLP